MATIRLQEETEYTNPATIKAAIKNTERSINNLTTQLQQNVESSAAKYIIAQIETLDKKLSSLQSKLRRSELLASRQRDAQEERAAIYNNICYLIDNFDNMDYTEKNELVKKITKKCILDGDELRIIF